MRQTCREIRSTRTDSVKILNFSCFNDCRGSSKDTFSPSSLRTTDHQITLKYLMINLITSVSFSHVKPWLQLFISRKSTSFASVNSSLLLGNTDKTPPLHDFHRRGVRVYFWAQEAASCTRIHLPFGLMWDCRGEQHREALYCHISMSGFSAWGHFKMNYMQPHITF